MRPTTCILLMTACWLTATAQPKATREHRQFINPRFQNWNYLVLNMLAWLEGRTVVSEF